MDGEKYSGEETMKIYIPSKGRATTITTHTLFKNYDYTVVVANEEEYTAYSNTIGIEHLVNAHIPYGVAYVRQWILDQVPQGEWFLMLDDNVSSFTALPEPEYTREELDPHIMSKETQDTFKKLFETEITTEQFLEICSQMIEKANIIGAHLCGFATVDNWYFRNKKWREVGYVITKMALVKKSHLTYDTAFTAMDDYYFTAENLLHFGKVLINNYVYRNATHYQDGGIGPYKEREPRKIADAELLMQRYPGLFRYKNKVGCHPKAEVQIRFTSLKQVAKWRAAMLKGIV
jgi:hypothetical protein